MFPFVTQILVVYQARKHIRVRKKNHSWEIRKVQKLSVLLLVLQPHYIPAHSV